ncbi:hypothetical protein QJS66_21425 [Kocuria rhizophila]|nr:hypothetical protein QJS66_21425 [Kocuria rhizophila]
MPAHHRRTSSTRTSTKPRDLRAVRCCVSLGDGLRPGSIIADADDAAQSPSWTPSPSSNRSAAWRPTCR